MSLRLVATSGRPPKGCGPAGCGEYPQHADGPGMRRGTDAYGTDMSYPPDMRGGMPQEYKDTAGGYSGWGRGGTPAPLFSNSSTPPMNGDMTQLARDMRTMLDRLSELEQKSGSMNEMRMRLNQMEQRMQYGSGGGMPQPMGFATPLSTVKSKASEMVSEAEEVLSSPPPTWGPYLQKTDYIGLVKMEAREMLSAVENNKSPEDIKKEVKHVLAAVLKLIGD